MFQEKSAIEHGQQKMKTYSELKSGYLQFDLQDRPEIFFFWK